MCLKVGRIWKSSLARRQQNGCGALHARTAEGHDQDRGGAIAEIPAVERNHQDPMALGGVFQVSGPDFSAAGFRARGQNRSPSRRLPGRRRVRFLPRLARETSRQNTRRCHSPIALDFEDLKFLHDQVNRIGQRTGLALFDQSLQVRECGRRDGGRYFFASCARQSRHVLLSSSYSAFYQINRGWKGRFVVCGLLLMGQQVGSHS